MTRYSIYIPTSKEGSMRVAEKVISKMIETYGGVTSTGGRGFWKNSQGEIDEENVLILSSVVDSTWGRKVEPVSLFMKGLATCVKEQLGEEAVLITSEPVSAQFI